MSAVLEKPKRVRAPETVALRCGSCGGLFELSTRADRSRRDAGREPVCVDCRFPPLIVVTDALLDWWRRRYDDAEIVELAEGVWGARAGWPPHDQWQIRREIGL